MKSQNIYDEEKSVHPDLVEQLGKALRFDYERLDNDRELFGCRVFVRIKLAQLSLERITNNQIEARDQQVESATASSVQIDAQKLEEENKQLWNTLERVHAHDPTLVPSDVVENMLRRRRQMGGRDEDA